MGEVRQIRIVSVPGFGGYSKYAIRCVAIPHNGNPYLLESQKGFYRPTTKTGRGKGPEYIAKLKLEYLA